MKTIVKILVENNNKKLGSFSATMDTNLSKISTDPVTICHGLSPEGRALILKEIYCNFKKEFIKQHKSMRNIAKQ